MKTQPQREENKNSRSNINEEIKAKRITLIDNVGENQGIVETNIALKKARDLDLDLVEMSASPNSTVCKIMDYGKYLFESSKKKKQSLKDSKGKNEIKEIRLRPVIENHDLETKSKQARKFIEVGKKVKLDIRLKGREKRHPELVKEVIDRFIKTLEDVAKLEVKGNVFTLIPR